MQRHVGNLRAFFILPELRQALADDPSLPLPELPEGQTEPLSLSPQSAGEGAGVAVA